MIYPEYVTDWIIAAIHAVVFLIFLIIFLTRFKHAFARSSENIKIFVVIWIIADAVCVTSLVLRSGIELDDDHKRVLWYIAFFFPNMTTIMVYLSGLICWYELPFYALMNN